jgi:hypothetical protein
VTAAVRGVVRTKLAEIRALDIDLSLGPDQDSLLHESVVSRFAT